MTGPLRVLIADDHAPTRAGVRVALEEAGCEVCDEWNVGTPERARFEMEYLVAVGTRR